MASVVAVRGDLARADRRMNARLGGRTSDRARARQTPEHGRRSVGAFLEQARRVRNACNLRRWVGELELRPGRDLVELGRAGARRRHRDGCPTRPDGRSGALACVSPSALVVAAPPASSLVVLTTKGGPGRASARSLPNDHCRAGVAENRGNEACACVGKPDVARLEHMTRQKEAGQLEAIGDVLRRRSVDRCVAQERR
jgi:hypothetical protein